MFVLNNLEANVCLGKHYWNNVYYITDTEGSNVFLHIIMPVHSGFLIGNCLTIKFARFIPVSVASALQLFKCEFMLRFIYLLLKMHITVKKWITLQAITTVVSLKLRF